MILNLLMAGVTLFFLYLYLGFWSYNAQAKLLKKSISEFDVRSIKPAVLQARSVPSECKVFVNGYYKGRTPSEIEVHSAGENKKEFKITFIKTDYIKKNININLKRGERRKIEVNLRNEKKY